MGDSPGIALAIVGGGAGVLSAAGLWAYSVFVPRCQFWGPVIRSLPQRNAVALTFEDGPDAEFTPRVLDVLAAEGVVGTFFVMGKRARELPAVLKRIHAEGHVIGNHSLDHAAGGWKRDRAYWDAQIQVTQEIVGGITGEVPVLFRPPWGYKTGHIAGAASAAKLPVIGWSVRAREKGVMDAGAYAHGVLRRTTGHDIVLMRDGADGDVDVREKMVEALPPIVTGIREKKLEIVSMVEALVAAGEEIRERKAKARLQG